MQGATYGGAGDQVGGRNAEAAEPQQDLSHRVETEQVVRHAHVEEKRKAGEQGEPQPDGDAAEHDHLADLFRRQAPARIEAVAHGAAAERRHAHVMTDGKARERRERRLTVRQSPARITHGQRVEQGQAEIGQDDETKGVDQPVSGDREHRLLDILPAIAAEAAVDEKDRQTDGKPDQDFQEAPPVRHSLSAACLVNGNETKRNVFPGHERSDLCRQHAEPPENPQLQCP
jgi:hypothetical protein